MSAIEVCPRLHRCCSSDPVLEGLAPSSTCSAASAHCHSCAARQTYDTALAIYEGRGGTLPQQEAKLTLLSNKAEALIKLGMFEDAGVGVWRMAAATHTTVHSSKDLLLLSPLRSLFMCSANPAWQLRYAARRSSSTVSTPRRCCGGHAQGSSRRHPLMNGTMTRIRLKVPA